MTVTLFHSSVSYAYIKSEIRRVPRSLIGEVGSAKSETPVIRRGRQARKNKILILKIIFETFELINFPFVSSAAADRYSYFEFGLRAEPVLRNTVFQQGEGPLGRQADANLPLRIHV